MKHILSIFILIYINISLYSQHHSTPDTAHADHAEDHYYDHEDHHDHMSAEKQGFFFGAFTEVNYSQPISGEKIYNGHLNVERMVFIANYTFNERTWFVSEIELEKVKEIFVEQAYVNHQIKPWLNFRAGLMLIPFGYINENHEPTIYHGVWRPNVDTYIVPTPWREIGIGFAGKFAHTGIKYQLYVVNGFKSYENGPLLDGASGLVGGRQMGADSYISSPNYSGKIEYVKIPGLRIGLSGYFGDTQSNLYHGILRSDPAALARADSSVVGVNMGGIDIRYKTGKWSFRTEYIIVELSGTNEYNLFTNNNLGSRITGIFAEAAREICLQSEHCQAFIPFVRFELFNTHADVPDCISTEESFRRMEILTGFGWKLHPNAILKADYQFTKVDGEHHWHHHLNMGVGISF